MPQSDCTTEITKVLNLDLSFVQTEVVGSIEAPRDHCRNMYKELRD